MINGISESLVVSFEKVSFEGRQSILGGFPGRILEYHRPVPGLQRKHCASVLSLSSQRSQKLPGDKFLRLVRVKGRGIRFPFKQLSIYVVIIKRFGLPVGLLVRVKALLSKAEAENGIVEQKIRMIYVTFRFKPYSFLKYRRFALTFIFIYSLFVGAVLSDKFQLTSNSFVPYKRSLFAADIDTAACKSNRAYNAKCKSPADSSGKYPPN